MTVVGVANGECAEYLVQGPACTLLNSWTAALVAHGFGVGEIRHERADLETVFLQLTHTEALECASC